MSDYSTKTVPELFHLHLFEIGNPRHIFDPEVEKGRFRVQDLVVIDVMDESDRHCIRFSAKKYRLSSDLFGGIGFQAPLKILVSWGESLKLAREETAPSFPGQHESKHQPTDDEGEPRAVENLACIGAEESGIHHEEQPC